MTASVNSEKTRMKKCMMIMIFNLNIFFLNAKYINKVLFDRLKPSNTKAPRFYGLPKIHKPDMPLRPIVSAIGSPTYSLAKFVTKIISPLTGQTVAHVLDFRNMILKERIDESEIMVSFDVKSLFTNVPIDKTLEVIGNKLINDQSLEERSILSPEQITKLVEVCLKTTYFV